MFPKKIYFEKAIEDYQLGRELLSKYSDKPQIQIENHNNIFELRTRPNSDFVEMKDYLIIGVRKTHKYVPNNKISNFLVPYTSSGCSAMCLYCYLVCNYNKCSYLRVFVNKDYMLSRLIKKSNEFDSSYVYEIGSNSDLILENIITGNLVETIEEFGKKGKGCLTFPTKFSKVDDLLSLNHNGKVIFRMSVNPEEIIKLVEIGTSRLLSRINALNDMCEAGYQVGMLIAPVVMIDNWKEHYLSLLDELSEKLSQKAKSSMFIEVIFMTYSYIHNAINEQAFPNAVMLYNKELMTGRGRGKYCYKPEYRREGEEFLRTEIAKRFSNTPISYIV